MELLVPAACTLPTAEQPLRLAEFDDLFATAVRGVESLGPTRARLQLSGPAGLGDRVRDLAAREARCCSFFAFSTTSQWLDGAERVVLGIEVPASQAGVLAVLVQRAGSGRAVSTDLSQPPGSADPSPPTSSKITASLAALACAACCALPLLITAGVLTGAGAAVLKQTLLAVAAGLAAAALGLWWLHRRRRARRAAAGGGCGTAGCAC